MLIRTIVLALALAAGAGQAQAEDYAGGAIKTADTSKGEVLTDAKGMSLYTFDKDKTGISTCYNQCATKWPPLTASAGAQPEGKFTLIERRDGSKQWAHDGRPLYRWQNDKKPGDLSGDGVGGVWHLATD
jgi:predicted lipoprotein with Yx(FWY)xxD motif